MEPPISVVVERGDVAETWHRAHAVTVLDGEVVRACGDPDLVTFMRSAAKPFQALPLAVEEPDLPEQELVIACASHDATEQQLELVRSLLARSGSSEEELECGEEGGSRLRHNCSGKHAGMLLRTKRRGWPLPGYRLGGHPLQEELRDVVAEALGVSGPELPTGVDGCGVPSFAASLRAMAAAFTRLGRGELAGAERVTAAMRAHPRLVGGPAAADTALMEALPGSLVKRGAEGLLCLVLADGAGVAVKVEDGANRAALPATAVFLGLEGLAAAPLFNSRGDEIGAIRAVSEKNRSRFSPGPL